MKLIRDNIKINNFNNEANFEERMSLKNKKSICVIANILEVYMICL